MELVNVPLVKLSMAVHAVHLKQLVPSAAAVILPIIVENLVLAQLDKPVKVTTVLVHPLKSCMRGLAAHPKHPALLAINVAVFQMVAVGR